MAEFIAWLSRFMSGWKLWIVVPPWEIAVRVRLGRTAVSLLPGPHLRLPLLDQVIAVNTRLRITTSPPATVRSTIRGFVVVRRAVAGYVVGDPLAAIQHYNSPMAAVDSLLQIVSKGDLGGVKALTKMRSELEPWGIHVEFVEFVDEAEVRAIRLFQNEWGVSSDGRGDHAMQRREF